MRSATRSDREWIESKLRSRIEGSMFPLANLETHGWNSDAPRAMKFWLDRDRGLLLGCTNEGMIMPIFVSADPESAVQSLSRRAAMGLLGVTGEVRAILPALELGETAMKLDQDEPQFLLDLSELQMPDLNGHLLPASDSLRDLLVAWRAGYVTETLGESEAEASATATIDVERQITAESHRVLVVDDRPVAVTGINAALSDIVQVGGVYTPPRLRRRGYARLAVALHLRELREAGVSKATLFASGEPAVRAYVSLGFKHVGSFSLVLFAAPQVLQS